MVYIVTYTQRDGNNLNQIQTELNTAGRFVLLTQ